jgi:leucine dehydrogenase
MAVAVAAVAHSKPASIEPVGFDHEQLVVRRGERSGLYCVVAVHSTVLGPALGGLRLWSYAEVIDAARDALRLAGGMTYKAAAAGLDLGGGKGVICAPPEGLSDSRRRAALLDFGDLVESLGGRYITAEDVGTSTADMDFVHMETKYVTGLANKSGDPSPVTAHGVFRSIQASAKHRWGSDSLEGKAITVQGLGHVGYYLCKELHAAHAKLIVTDIDASRVKRVVDEFGAQAVEHDAIFGTKADIFAPCALGGIINDKTVPKLRVEIVSGGANNQLLEERHGEALEARGILYAPDYVANAGGVINVYSELAGWTRERSLRKADEIYDTLLGVFELAREQSIPTYVAADRLAERRLKAVGSLMRTWPPFPREE